MESRTGTEQSKASFDKATHFSCITSKLKWFIALQRKIYSANHNLKLFRQNWFKRQNQLYGLVKIFWFCQLFWRMNACFMFLEVLPSFILSIKLFFKLSFNHLTIMQLQSKQNQFSEGCRVRQRNPKGPIFAQDLLFFNCYFSTRLYVQLY